jgi:thiol-disulfide isomerase/thioredoxin
MSYTIQYYGAVWCNPCKAAKPLVENLCKKFGVKMEMFDYDTDLEDEVKDTITKLPTIRVCDTSQQNKKVLEITTKHAETLESWLTANVRLETSDDF